MDVKEDSKRKVGWKSGPAGSMGQDAWRAELHGKDVLPGRKDMLPGSRHTVPKKDQSPRDGTRSVHQRRCQELTEEDPDDRMRCWLSQDTHTGSLTEEPSTWPSRQR